MLPPAHRLRLLLICLVPAVTLMLLAGPFTQIGIAQLGLPASMVGGLVALHPLTAVVRPILGRLSDRRPLLGYRRSGYLAVGVVWVWLMQPLPLLGLLLLGHHWPQLDGLARLGAVLAEAATMVLLGLGSQLTQTMLCALLLDTAPPPQRGRAIAELFLVQITLLVVVSLASSQLLRLGAFLPLATRLLGLWLVWLVVALPLVLVCLRRLEVRIATRPGPAPAAGLGPIGTMAVAGAGTPSQDVGGGPSPVRVDRALLGFLLIAYPALFVQEVLLDPYASRLFGWSLASTTALGGLWALGAVAGLLLGRVCGWQRALSGGLATMAAYVLLALGGLRPMILPLPLPVLLLGAGAGLTQAWLAEQIARRCNGQRLGEQAGGWSAAVVLSRCLGLALAGPLLDLSLHVFDLPQGRAYALAFGLAAAFSAAGLALVPRVERGAFGRMPPHNGGTWKTPAWLSSAPWPRR
jgi:BCD family chlorophyll transporter-like MFS transporter